MSKPIAPWRWIVALTGVSLGFGAVLAAFATMTRDAGPAALIGMAVVVAGLSAIAVWLTAMYWRRIDEAAREAHKWAWFWGGNVALLPVMVGFVLLLQRPELPAPLWPGFEPTPAHYVATGGIMVVLLLIVGYALAWLFWWLWKSR